MGRNQCKKEKNTRNQNTSPPTKDQNSSAAREQSWMENECDEMTESDFRRGVMRKFRELKEHVLNQCKETKNLEKKFWENDNRNGQLREEYEWIEGAEKHNIRTSRSMHKFQQPNWSRKRKNIRSPRSTQWNKTRNQDQRKKHKKEWTKSPRNVGLCEET